MNAKGIASGRRAAVTVLAFVALVLGTAAAINALDAPLTASRGAQLWRLFAMNEAGALLTILGGLLALGSAAKRSRAPAEAAGLLFLGAAALTLVGVGRSFNLLGGRASTMSFFLMLGMGLLTLAVSPELGVPGLASPEVSDEP